MLSGYCMATPHSTPPDILSTYRQGRLPAPYLVAKQNKYKLFLDIFIYVNIQEISAQTLLTLIYKLLENEDIYKP